MAITLRANKNAALTYEELDLNFHSFFYSASISSDLTQLSLHFTGSTLQAASAVNIPLNPYTGSDPQVAGNIGELQFKSGNTSFGGAGEVHYDNSTGVDALVIGATTAESGDKLRVEGGRLVVKDTSFHLASGTVSSSFSMGGTTKDLTIRNSFADDNADIIFETNNGDEVIRLKGDGTVTHKGSNAALGDFVISGSVIFGKTHEDLYRSKLFTWDSGNSRIHNSAGSNDLLDGNERGVIIEGPQTGHVVVGIQSSTGKEAFSVISGPPTSSQEPTHNKLVASFRADGRVGLGTSEPATGYTLGVVGSISGSGGLNIAGNTVITGSITTNATLNVSGSSTLSGSVTLNTVANASSATNYNFLVRETNGNIAQQVNAAPIPVGGIIMWSGAIANIPSGWNLCDGGTYNSTVTPDLRNKFIVGAHSDLSGVAKSSVEGSSTFTQTGGDVNHNHGSSTGNTTLSTNQIPAHQHTYKDSYYIEYNNPGQGAGGTIGGADYVSTKYKGSGDSDGDNDWVYWRNGTTNANTTSNASHNHSITSNNHLPPYFALAYIMYTG